LQHSDIARQEDAQLIGGFSGLQGIIDITSRWNGPRARRENYLQDRCGAAQLEAAIPKNKKEMKDEYT
jgi:hypothetical protein